LLPLLLLLPLWDGEGERGKTHAHKMVNRDFPSPPSFCAGKNWEGRYILEQVWRLSAMIMHAGR
jgi:hypothetical protein